MKCKAFVFIFICGYLLIYCNGEDYTSSSTSSSIKTSITNDDVSSTYVVSSTDSTSSTAGKSTDNNVSPKNGKNSDDDGSSTTYNNGFSTASSTLLPVDTNNINSKNHKNSNDDGSSSHYDNSFTTTLSTLLPVDTNNVSPKNGKNSNDDGSSSHYENGFTTTLSTLLPVDTAKKVIVKDVVKKICTLAKKSLKNAKKEDRPEILRKLELKLKKASRSTGNGQPYVDIIMKGIKSIAQTNDYSVCEEEEHKEDNIVNAPPDFTSSTSTKPKIQVIKQNDTVISEPQLPIIRSQNDMVKEKLLKTMIEKLESMAKKSFKNVTKPEEKMIILEKIKKKLLKVMKNQNETLNSVNTTYTELILKAIKWILNKDKGSRRMTFDFIDDNKEKQRREPGVMFLKQQGGLPPSTQYPFLSSAGVTTEYDCSAIQKKICKSINLLNEFICSYDDTVISVERICDGHADCPDGSDEKDCAKQAISRTHNATEILKDVGFAKVCLFPLMDNSMFSNQAKMMTEVLTNEIHFINKYAKLYPSRSEKEKFHELNERSLKDLCSDVCFLLRSFVIAMDGALCTDTLQSVDEMVKKLSDPIDRALTEDVDTPLKDFKMKICDCNGPFCANITCPSGCRRICYQRNSLMQWTCRATDGSNGVTMDLICDGKFDCYDETDETGCVLYNAAVKFEANKIYDGILKTIRSLLGHFGFEMARSQLGQLHDTIRTLQIKSTNPKTLNEEFKKFRNKAFKLIVGIYDETLNSVAVELKTESAFDYLESIKEKLIVALKKTFTGNKKIIAPDGCFCRGLECAVPVCSRKCIRTCMSKPKLTRYLCPSTNSTSIPFEQICNGRKNCPKGEDEDKCKPELCRRHHIVNLRAKLSKVGDKHAGTVLGEVLKNWRVKALANLRVLENLERPTATDFKLAMSEMLDHLVVSYATLEDYRRFKSSQIILSKFEKLAQNMMEILKACTNFGFVYPGGPVVQSSAIK